MPASLDSSRVSVSRATPECQRLDQQFESATATLATKQAYADCLDQLYPAKAHVIEGATLIMMLLALAVWGPSTRRDPLRA